MYVTFISGCCFYRRFWYSDEVLSCTRNSGVDYLTYRFAEKYQVKGIVVVSPCVTDLGIANERASGEYNYVHFYKT